MHHLFDDQKVKYTLISSSDIKANVLSLAFWADVAEVKHFNSTVTPFFPTPFLLGCPQKITSCKVISVINLYLEGT